MIVAELGSVVRAPLARPPPVWCVPLPLTLTDRDSGFPSSPKTSPLEVWCHVTVAQTLDTSPRPLVGRGPAGG